MSCVILAARGASDVPGGPSCEKRQRRVLSRIGASSGSPAHAVGERAAAAVYAAVRITTARIAPYFAHYYQAYVYHTYVAVVEVRRARASRCVALVVTLIANLRRSNRQDATLDPIVARPESAPQPAVQPCTPSRSHRVLSSPGDARTFITIVASTSAATTRRPSRRRYRTSDRISTTRRPLN